MITNVRLIFFPHIKWHPWGKKSSGLLFSLLITSFLKAGTIFIIPGFHPMAGTWDMLNNGLLIRWIHDVGRGLAQVKLQISIIQMPNIEPALITEAETQGEHPGPLVIHLINQVFVEWQIPATCQPQSWMLGTKQGSCPSGVNNANSIDSQETIQERVSVWSSIKQKLADRGPSGDAEFECRMLQKSAPSSIVRHECRQWNRKSEAQISK